MSEEYQFSQPGNRLWLAWGKSGRRPLENARQDVDALLAHIAAGTTRGELHQEAIDELARFCMDVTQSIAWYERAGRRMSVWQCVQYLFVLGFGAGSMAVIVHFMDKTQNVGFAQAGAVFGAVLVVLQVMSSALDTKTVIAGFRKACADLKERLYDFEEKWRGANDILGEDKEGKKTLSAKFKADLVDTRRAARKIEQDERNAFFNALKSPTELLASVNTALDGLRGKRTEFRAAQEAAAKEATATLAGHVRSALQEVSAAETRLAALNGKPETELAPVRDELTKAQKKLSEAQDSLLRAVGK